MVRRFFAVLLMAASIFGVSCGAMMGTSMMGPSGDKFAQLHQGMTPQQVQTVVGAPGDVAAAGTKTTWKYRSLDLASGWTAREVVFENDLLVSMGIDAAEQKRIDEAEAAERQRQHEERLASTLSHPSPAPPEDSTQVLIVHETTTVMSEPGGHDTPNPVDNEDHARQATPEALVARCEALALSQAQHQECRELIETSSYWDRDVAQYCFDEVRADNQKLSCLAVIRGKKYRIGELRDCSQRDRIERQLRCFENSGILVGRVRGVDAEGAGVRSNTGNHQSAAYVGDDDDAETTQRANFRQVAGLLCNQLDSSYEQDRCWKILKDARFMNVEAISVCALESSAYDQQECLNAIRERDYIAAELSLCKSKSSTYDREKCLKVRGRPPEQILKRHVRRGLNAAGELCNRRQSSYDQDKCWEVVKDARFLDVDAVGVCEQDAATYDQLKCLETICNKRYLPAEAQLCRSKGSHYDRNRCLEEHGKAE